MSKAIRAIIIGRVQGVGYRAWVVKEANRLGLTGWVRNLNNGNVEAIFSGEQDAILAMIESCRKGPMLARVDAIERFPWNEPVEERAFLTRPTL